MTETQISALIESVAGNMPAELKANLAELLTIAIESGFVPEDAVAEMNPGVVVGFLKLADLQRQIGFRDALEAQENGHDASTLLGGVYDSTRGVMVDSAIPEFGDDFDGFDDSLTAEEGCADN